MAPDDNGAIGALAELPTADVDDPTRRLGNWEMYTLYTQAAGKLTLGIFMLAMAAYAFCASFPCRILAWSIVVTCANMLYSCLAWMVGKEGR